MEDNYIIIDQPLQEYTEDKPLLQQPAKRSSSVRHSRSVSYGSFLPHFSIDLYSLKRLIPREKKDESDQVNQIYTRTDTGQEEPATKQEEVVLTREDSCPSKEEPANYQEVLIVEESNSSSEQQQLPGRPGHHHTDSVIESPTQFLDKEAFLTECDRQIQLLLEFTSLHVTRIQEEMELYRTRTEQPVLPVRPYNQINSIPEDEEKASLDDDIKSIGGDSGIEDDHLTSPKGFLSRIREVAISLKTNLETSLQQLDEMVGAYDHRTGNTSGQMLLAKCNSQKQDLNEQIEGCLSKIDEELELINSKEKHNKDKITITTLAKAKQQSLGVCDGFAFFLLLLVMVVTSGLAAYYPASRWVILLRLIRSPLFVVLFIYLIGVNIMVWARVNINYISIFNFPDKGIPTPKIIFRVASVLTVLFSLLSIACFATGHVALYITDKVVGLSMWLILLLFVINPFNVFIRRGRISFILVVVRILISPFPVVSFGDFWFADQLNSTVALLLDVQFLLCYIGMDTWNSGLNLKTCTSSNNGIRPVISCLPSLWRFLQCLRCYQKTKKIAHLINAVKYFTTFPVVIFATIFAMKVKPSMSLVHLDLREIGWVVILWLISSFVHAIYCFLWDVRMDWGLFCFSHRTILRPTLLYPKWVYFVAIVFDFIIRFACALKLTLAIVYHLDSDLIYSGLIVAEMLRRWVWNFFRLEYEQVLRSSNI